MKKIIIAAVAILLLAGAGGGWYVFAHRGDPLQNARALMGQGNLRAASIELRNAVRDNPSSAEAHARLAQTQLVMGDPVAAEKEIKQAMDLGWNRSSGLTLLAQAYLGQSEWKKILAEIPTSGASADQTALFLIARATAQFSLGDAAAAKASVAEAEQIAPGNPEPRLISARLALRQNDRALAMKEVDQALALAPKRSDALDFKALLMALAGDSRAALSFEDQAVAGSPTSNVYRLNRAGYALNAGEDAKSREDVDAILAKQPNNYVAMYVQMVLLVRAGMYSEADLIAQKLDPVISRFPRGLFFQAFIKYNLHQTAQALDTATRYNARVPGDSDGVRLLARIDMDTGRADQASALLSRAVTAGLDDGEMLDLLGRTYVMQGKPDEADKAFRQASQAVKKPDQLKQIATSLLSVGDLQAANVAFQRTVEMAPAESGVSEQLVGTSIALGELDRAQAALDQLRQRTGDTEAVGLLTGVLKLARFDLNGALEQFKATAQKFPDATAPRLNEAKVLIQLGRSAEAIPVLQELVAKNPTNADALSLLVPALIAEKRNQEAVAVVDAARAAAPTNLGILQGAAEMYAALKDLPKALAVLDSAKVNGTLPPGLLPLQARLQLAAGQPDAAKASYTELASAEPNNVGVRRLLIEFLVHQKDYTGARAAAQEALRAFPGDGAIMGLLVAADQLDKGLDTALATADKLRAEPTNMPSAALLKGDLYMGARRFSDAAAAYGAEFRLDPSSQPLMLRLSAALRAGGDPAKADSLLTAWQASHPEDIEVAQLLASQQLGEHRYADAERNLQIVLKQRPNDPIALNNLAWIYQSKGDQRARATAQHAYMQSPNPAAADTLGWIMVSQGEADKALPLLQRAVAALPNELNAKYHLAVALKDLNRKDEAVSILRPLVSDPASFDDKSAAQQLLAQLTAAKP